MVLNTIINFLFKFFDNNENKTDVVDSSRYCSEENRDNNLIDDNITQLPPIIDNAISYLFQRTTMCINDQSVFSVRYFTLKGQLWLVGYDFARGIGYRRPDDALSRYVEFKNAKSTETLLFGVVADSSTRSIVCINRAGALQLLDNIECGNKAEAAARVVDKLNELAATQRDDDRTHSKLDKMLQAIDVVGTNNAVLLSYHDVLKNEFLNKFDTFNEKINKIDEKIRQYDNLDRLYTQLQEHRKPSAASITRAPVSVGSGLSFLEERHLDRRDTAGCVKYETVKFPKNVAKHPRLAVFVKPDGDGTQMSFLAGQQRNINARKRNYRNMEMIYDYVHPNPILAVHCIDEELQHKNFKYIKLGKRTYHVHCDVDTIKSFIHENV
ncbi:38.7K [Orgyia leucostigma nucleopolyhedrovirus]|uniref:38.7K n=1 Tax=Orgyia leucostigma nucleopolyhedrovirus TaxID=490711 RepID=B0FE01_9ABAC|nr:38.7K [Orgyia leucostigma nucleopolyhedrovirus]ABY65859.1 38.7K [Orgyia leucostigma nucleopolyhedrovirus]